MEMDMDMDSKMLEISMLPWNFKHWYKTRHDIS